MNATARELHLARCRDPYCPACETEAESRAADESATFDESGAMDTYERFFDGPGGI